MSTLIIRWVIFLINGEPAKSNQWEGTLFIYYQKDYPNLIVFQTNQQNYTNLRPTYIQPLKEKNFEISVAIRYGRAIEFRNYYKDNTHKKYSILCYDIGSVKDLIFKAKRKTEEDKIKEKSENENKVSGRIDRDQYFGLNLQAGNENFELKNFDKAIYHYKLAKTFLGPEETEKLADLDRRITECGNEKSQADYMQFKLEADDFYKQKRYEESLLNYRNAFKINQKEKYIGERISCLEEIIKINQSGNAEQNYRTVNPRGYSQFNQLNLRALNSMMEDTKNPGFLNYTINVKFDGKGNNQSSLKINTISDDQLMFYLTDISASFIPPSEVRINCIPGTLTIPSKDILVFDLKWNIHTFNAIAGKEIPFAFTRADKDSITSFIKRQSDHTGIYTFRVLDKELNGKKYQDVSLIDYKDKLIIGSMFLPGLTEIKSYDRNKGKLMMGAFFLSAALSIGSKIYSDSQFHKYKDPLNYQNRNKYYTNANTANKVFLISGGIAITVYLYDITAIIIGKKSHGYRNLKADLKNGPIILTESSFKP